VRVLRFLGHSSGRGPLGDQGQGFGSVDALWSWAQSSGRAYTAGSGQQPQPGDLIVFHEHVGIVEGVLRAGFAARRGGGLCTRGIAR
jgi:hypothetical protein